MRKANYKIELNIDQARRNGELITIGQNQVIISILKIQGRSFSQDKLNELLSMRKKLRSNSSSTDNIASLLKVEDEINNMLFIPEMVSISMDKKQHYDSIIKKGFIINGIEFVRLLCGAGHSRRNTVIFCSKDIEKTLKEILNNGRKKENMVLAKNNAYLALSYSGTMQVSEPYFCVIPDYETRRKELVEFIEDDNEIKTEERELDFNIFDGQGMISPRLAKIWAKEIGIDDYIPSCFIIRNSFLKGLVFVADFHKFSEEIAEVHLIKDAWGNLVNVRDMDLILTTSQFKAWSSYSSCSEYIQNCRRNNFSFGITRASPKKDNNYVFSNYQFLQVLDIKEEDLPSLCKKTLDYFSGVMGGDIAHTLLYLLGNLTQEYDEDIYNKISDPITKALILNNSLINDPYVKNHIIHSLNKKIRESYIGNLILDGNYSFIVQDPYAFMEYVFGLPVQGLLGREEHYSFFWNQKATSKVTAMRAPLTWRSEANILNLKKNEKMEEWYSYLNAGATIYNIHSCDMMLHADADGDGDLVFTTDQREFLNNSYGGLPITYEKKKAQKLPVDESQLWKVDKLSFDSKIGYITNCSTTLYAMLPTISEDDKKEELIKRLKLCRRKQGDQIDLAKGIEIDPFPKHWTNWTKITEEMTDEEKEEAKFNNSILIDKRPYFFRYLYSNYNRDHVNYEKSYNSYCITTFGKGLSAISGSPLGVEEEETACKYLRRSPLLDSDCTMNRICHYLEKSIKEIKDDQKFMADEEIKNILIDHSIPQDEEKISKMGDLYNKYKSEKRNFSNLKGGGGENLFKTMDQYCKHIRKEASKISSDEGELANIAVALCYTLYPHDSKSFVWSIFSNGIIKNIEKKRQERCLVPFMDEKGDIEYLGGKYTLFEIKPKCEEDDDYEFYFQ